MPQRPALSFVASVVVCATSASACSDLAALAIRANTTVTKPDPMATGGADARNVAPAFPVPRSPAVTSSAAKVPGVAAPLGPPPAARPSPPPAAVHPSPLPAGAGTPPPLVPAIAADLPALYKRLYGAASVTVEGDTVVVKTTSEPDHGSPYYTGDRYAADGEPGFHINPNRIVASVVTLRLPLHPAPDPAHQATPLGPIGVALDGVVYFNQYAAGRQPLTSEAVSFDQYGGHPNQDGQYHYHVEPTWLTGKYGKDAFLGFLADGYPVYGPQEGTKTLASADLDAYHGHEGPTAEFPRGTYHYHITADAPYLCGTGYYGKPGSIVDAAMVKNLPAGCPTPPPPGERPSPLPGGPPSGCPGPPPGGV